MKILVILGEKKPEVENIRALNLAGNKGLSRRCLQYRLKSVRHNLLYKARTDTRLERVCIFTSVSRSWADTGGHAFQAMDMRPIVYRDCRFESHRGHG